MSLDFIELAQNTQGSYTTHGIDKYHTAHAAFVTVLMSAHIGTDCLRTAVKALIIYLFDKTDAEGFCLHTNNVVYKLGELSLDSSYRGLLQLLNNWIRKAKKNFFLLTTQKDPT